MMDESLRQIYIFTTTTIDDEAGTSQLLIMVRAVPLYLWGTSLQTLLEGASVTTGCCSSDN